MKKIIKDLNFKYTLEEMFSLQNTTDKKYFIKLTKNFEKIEKLISKGIELDKKNIQKNIELKLKNHELLLDALQEHTILILNAHNSIKRTFKIVHIMNIYETDTFSKIISDQEKCSEFLNISFIDLMKLVHIDYNDIAIFLHFNSYRNIIVHLSGGVGLSNMDIEKIQKIKLLINDISSMFEKFVVKHKTILQKRSQYLETLKKKDKDVDN